MEAVSFSRFGSRTRLTQCPFHCVLLAQQIEEEETELQLSVLKKFSASYIWILGEA